MTTPTNAATVSQQINCAQCDNPGLNDGLTAVCNTCCRWYHSMCVGASEAIPVGSWLCPPCVATANRRSEIRSIKSGSSTRSARIRLELMRLEEEKRAREKHILEREEQEKLRDMQILKERQELELKYINDKYKLLKLEVLEGDDESIISKRSDTSNIMRWIKTQPGPSEAGNQSDAGYEPGSVERASENQDFLLEQQPLPPQVHPLYPPQYAHQQPVYPQQFVPPQQFEPPQPFVPPQQFVPLPQQWHPDVQFPLQQSMPHLPSQWFAPNQQNSQTVPLMIPPTHNAEFGRHVGPYRQFAARQVVPKDLPMFDGNPEDWPLFISSYRNSTEMCGFTQAENLMRLQKCLRGKALNTVRSMLLLPSAVPEVLEQLESTFGNPEKLVQALVAKVEKTPAPKADDLAGVANLGAVVQNLVGFLKAANQEKHLMNPTVLDTLVQKLPPNIRINWGMFKLNVESVNLETFSNYLKVVSKAANDVTPYTEDVERSKSKLKERSFINTHSVGEDSNLEVHSKTDDCNNKALGKPISQDKPCFTCQKTGHRVKQCFKFKSLSLNDRWKAVENQQLCPRCLVPHGKWPCKTTKACDVSGCADGHHSLLHPGKPNIDSGDSSKVAMVSVHRQPESKVLFRIVPVILYGHDKQIETFAFIDEGSSLTLMDVDIANQLDLQGDRKPLCLKWTSNVTRDETDSRQLTLEISACGGGQRFSLRDVRTVRQLDLPVQTLCYDSLAKKFPHLQKLPVKSYENAAPRVLIGLNNMKLAAPLKRRIGSDNEPVAMKTRLGWTICGTMNEGSNTAQILHICECGGEEDQSLHNLVKGFFAMENLGISARPSPEAAEDVRANTILRDTTVKCADGHFETGLLWRYDQVEFPRSYTMAERCLQCLERRLRTKPELLENFHAQILEYQRKGYAHKATKQELELADEKRVWYLPIGIVINPKKPHKLRLIWNAAAMVDGVSFNSMLLKGPDQLSKLPRCLHRFRQRQICLTGDIEEMYHQVRIRESDRISQRFLYRTDPTKPPEIYIMDVATFGSTCSPCSAQYIKNINAQEWEKEFPEAAVAIVENHYVDDYLDSRDTEEEMAKLASNVRTVHAKAGFKIRNWLSNSTEVLRRLGTDPINSNEVFVIDKSHKTERVLGMAWHPVIDAFTFSVALSEDLQQMVSGNKTVTKRGILRLVMTLFDPHGFIAHFIVHGKILIQDLWRSGVSWDEPIPPEILERWERWIGYLSHLHQVQVPRCYFPGYDVESLKNVELHVFVDASEMAYASVAYFRIIDRGQVRCAFVSAKTKVAPLRSTSIPRLELEATLLGCRQAKTITEDHTLPIVRTTIWTDSTTVLSWIRSDTRKYKQYVGVRLGEILEDADVSNFRWVPTKLNVADDATKWANGPNLEPNSRWFTGPDFLYLPDAEWPQQTFPVVETNEELRTVHVHQEINHEEIIDCSRFSRWERLLRTMAYVYHFVDVCRTPRLERNDLLVQNDFMRAERALWRVAQMATYADELTDMSPTRRPSHMRNNSPLRKLCPFLDEYGVIRMEGRIGASPYADYDAKYPIILPKNHAVTLLLIDWYHRKQGHAFGETVVNQMRQKFHISNLRTLTRNPKKWCQWCRIYKATPQTPRMGPLPEARLVAYERVFTRVGIDYFGPMAIKIGRVQVKRWVALFTCLASRAVHLEVVASLSTDSCKQAIRRFIARRGAPAEIFSDNGTNFLGTSRELTEQISAVLPGLAETFTNAETKWTFIPPGTPHMGGVWERMVRSVKSAMLSLNDLRTPTEEVFQTVVVEAESMINSRPLTYLPLETSDEESLTPNHFIMLSSTGVKQPVKQPTSDAEALKSGYHLSQLMLDRFWEKWIQEYMSVITRTTKWFKDVKSIEVGDLVLIVDEKVRNHWPRGRVVRLLPGADRRIRQADVLTGDQKVCLCAVANLALLDVKRNGNAGESQQRHGPGDVGTHPADASEQQPGCSHPPNIEILEQPQSDESDASDDRIDS